MKTYRDGKVDWSGYERDFLALMKERRVEESLPKDLLDGGCLLRSEATSEHCHRRLLAQYLSTHWAGIEIIHLA